MYELIQTHCKTILDCLFLPFICKMVCNFVMLDYTTQMSLTDNRINVWILNKWLKSLKSEKSRKFKNIHVCTILRVQAFWLIYTWHSRTIYKYKIQISFVEPSQCLKTVSKKEALFVYVIVFKLKRIQLLIIDSYLLVKMQFYFTSYLTCNKHWRL